MDRLRSLLSRVRWGSVIAVILLVIAVAIIYSKIPSGYNIGGNIGLSASVMETSVSPGSDIVLSLELKNMDSVKAMDIQVSGTTYHELLIFDETYTKSYVSQIISIGPQETRKFSIKLRSQQGIIPGQYAIDLKAYERGKQENGATQRIFINIKEQA
jgi:uncharacterized membrane protein